MQVPLCTGSLLLGSFKPLHPILCCGRLSQASLPVRNTCASASSPSFPGSFKPPFFAPWLLQAPPCFLVNSKLCPGRLSLASLPVRNTCAFPPAVSGKDCLPPPCFVLGVVTKPVAGCSYFSSLSPVLPPPPASSGCPSPPPPQHPSPRRCHSPSRLCRTLGCRWRKGTRATETTA